MKNVLKSIFQFMHARAFSFVLTLPNIKIELVQNKLFDHLIMTTNLKHGQNTCQHIHKCIHKMEISLMERGASVFSVALKIIPWVIQNYAIP